MKVKTIAAIFLVAMIYFCPTLRAIEFSYKFNAGDKYRVLSTVSEDIFVERRLAYRAQIVNRITFEVSALTGDRARLSAGFQSAEKTEELGVGGKSVSVSDFEWSKDYQSEYEQDRLGYMFVGNQYYKPMVRDVPVFPDRSLKPGDSWSANGTEVHDFRDSFGIETPYIIPFTAFYTYLGERTWKDKEYHAFTVTYRVFFVFFSFWWEVYPTRIQSSSDQTIYWDLEQGQAMAYEEYFRLVFNLSDGQTWEYRGRAEAEVIEAEPMEMDDIAKEIAEEISEIPDTSVRITEKGIVISLDKIQFAPDSTILSQAEKTKLDAVAEVLMKYPERDILVGGHTALAGSAAGRYQISKERAASVAEYLISKNVRPRERIIVLGYGADDPIADNTTTAGMERNRRVEIIILEN
jgi:outer membrane protein OmpA-like peptidoglycan-associated protein